MKWLDRLNRRFGKYSIKNLMIYIVAANMLVFLLSLADRTGIIQSSLQLNPGLVLRGEVWRLVTFIFIPPQTSILLILFALYFYYMVGTSLEREWGSFKFNVYYLIGMLGTAVAAFIVWGPSTGMYLNLSLFLAFARLFPNHQILLFFFIPIKVKYLAWLNWALIAYTLLTSPLPDKVAAVASVINFLIFFGRDIVVQLKRGRSSYANRQRFNAKLPRDFTMHRCHVCGITEKDDPRMDFRYCMLCEGDYEYCEKHLNNHVHIKQTPGGGESE